MTGPTATRDPGTAGVSRDDIEAAAARVGGHVRVTPVISWRPPTGRAAEPIRLKLESLQHAGSFKPRGAFNSLLGQPLPEAGVIAASGGNHGLAVAYAARQLGVPAEIFIPVTSSRIKADQLARYGARVTRVGREYAEALRASLVRADQTGARVVHAYDQPRVVAGQGTLARELERQLDGAVDTVLVAVGGGGLLAGIASWFDGRVRVIGVEPARIPTLAAAFEAGGPVPVEVGGLAAESLGARQLGDIAYAVARRAGVGSVLVDESALVETRRLLWDELRLPVEFGGAAALGAICSGAYVPESGERVAVIICGGNTDPSDLMPGDVPSSGHG